MVPGPIPDNDVAVAVASWSFFRRTHVRADPSGFSTDLRIGTPAHLRLAMTNVTIDPEGPTGIRLGPLTEPEHCVPFAQPILADDGDTLTTLHGVEIGRTSLLVTGAHLRLGRSVKLHFDLLGRPVCIIAVVEWSMAGATTSISRLRFGVTSREGHDLLSRMLAESVTMQPIERAPTEEVQVGPGDAEADPDEDEVTAIWRRTPTGLSKVAPGKSEDEAPAPVPAPAKVSRRSGGSGLLRACVRPRRPSRRACFGAPASRRPAVSPSARR